MACWGTAVEAALRRVLTQTDRQLPAATAGSRPKHGKLAYRLMVIRDAVAACDPTLAVHGPIPATAVDLLAIAERTLTRYAEMHGHQGQRPVLTDSSDPATGATP